MAKTAIAFLLVFFGTLCIFQESISIPQNSIPISGGGAQMSNQTASMPGSGYPAEYYSNHSNETAPTSPTINSGSMDIQNSTMPTTCDCAQMTNIDQPQAPGGADAAGAESAGSGAATASRK